MGETALIRGSCAIRDPTAEMVRTNRPSCASNKPCAHQETSSVTAKSVSQMSECAMASWTAWTRLTSSSATTSEGAMVISSNVTMENVYHRATSVTTSSSMSLRIPTKSKFL